jgi:hypothetical protein
MLTNAQLTTMQYNSAYVLSTAICNKQAKRALAVVNALNFVIREEYSTCNVQQIYSAMQHNKYTRKQFKACIKLILKHCATRINT